MRTPWGESQTIENVADGIKDISTAGHGGIWLSAERMRQLPDAFKGKVLWAGKGWYEEDCDWAVPYLSFSTEFLAYERSKYGKEGEDRFARNIKAAQETLLRYHPDLYEGYFGVEVEKDENGYGKHVKETFAV